MINRRRFVGSSGLLLAAGPLLAESPRGFFHGVASGDPLADRVILWSRISGFSGPVGALLEIAATADFRKVLRRVSVTTDATRDFTLKQDVAGLQPGSTYYYRFTVNSLVSPIGRTRTLPASDVSSVKLAVVSCSNYPAGYFNVYRTIGHYNDLDAVIHLGDYIYEYPADGYASERAAEFGRLSEPRTEVSALTDYRMRYAQYRSDEDLQYAHSRVPFIVIWDDHEIANDAWTTGAQNHNQGEGDYSARKAAALQAFYEWLPVREPVDRPLEAAYRSFDFGSIASLAMIETRLVARTKPLDYSHDLPPLEGWFSEGRRGELLSTENVFDNGDSTLKRIPQIFDVRNGEPVSIRSTQEHKRLSALDALPQGYAYLPDTDRFMRELYPDRSRELLGEQQLNWLSATRDKASRSGTRWQILGNQTLLTPLIAPNLHRELSREEVNRIPDYLRRLVPLTDYGLPLNLDSWDGYAADRQRLYDRLADTENNLVLTGDTHNAWAAPLRNPAKGSQHGFEIATPSVSSPGIATGLKQDPARMEALFRAANPHFEHIELSDRGYVLLELGKSSARSSFRAVNTIFERRFTARTAYQITHT